MSGEQEPPALWEESLEGPFMLSDEQSEQVAQWLEELWERYRNDLPWTDSQG